MRAPSGLNVALLTQLVCPSRLATNAPLAASQTRAVLSPEACDDARAIRAERRAVSHTRVPFQVRHQAPRFARPTIDAVLVSRGE